MRDEKELRLVGHRAHEIREALGVRVVERRVDLVEQAERRRIQLEHREHERGRRQRLLAARQQVNRRVLLAGRLRHHLHAGVENLVARHDELRLPAAEQAREQIAEMAVHFVEGRLQERARFLVDLADRVLERLDRVRQIGRLRIEEHLALARGRELVERRHVDRAERVDRVVDPRDLALQVRRLHVRHELFLQRGLVDLGRRELLGELLARHTRRLLLQLQLGDAIAQRLQRALGGEPRLVGRAQLRREIVELRARGAERLLLRRAHFERVLQAGVRGLLVDRLELRARILQRRRDALGLLVRDLDRALQLVDAVRGLARGEARVGGRALALARLLARVRQRLVERFERELIVLEARLQFGELGVVALEIRLRLRAQRTLLLDLRADLLEFLADLRAALRIALVRLRELEHVHLQRVHALRRTLGLRAHFGQRLRRLRVCRFRSDRRRLRLVGQERLRAHLARQVLDFLRAREHARLLGVGRVELHARARDDVARLHDERAALRQLHARGERLREVVGDEHRAEPIVEHRAQARVVDAHERQERAQRARRGERLARGGRRVERELRGRRVGGERLHPVEIRHFERGEPLAQHRFERGFPAGLDVQLLPQTRQRAELVLVEPRLDLALRLHVFLQLLERGETRFELMDLRALGLHALVRRAALRVEARQRFLRVGEARLRLGQHRLVLGELHPQLLELRLVRRVEAARLDLQALVALLQLLQLLIGVALVRGFELQRLFGLRDPAALVVQARLRIAPARLERGQRVVLRGRVVLGDRRLFVGDRARLFGRFEIALRLVRLRAPLLLLRDERGDLRLHAVARLDDELDLRLEPAHLGVRLVERALRALHRVARRIVRDAQRLELRLDFAQLRGLRVELDLRVADRTALPVLLGGRLVLAQQPQQALLLLAVGDELFVLRRDHRLRLELLEIRAELADDVLDARQILARVVQPVLGLAAALLVLRHARRLFEEHAQLFGLRLDDPRDHPLPDDRVRTRAEARAEEDVLDVAAPRGQIVDVIARRAVAREHALHGDLAVLAPLAGRAAVGVVEDQLDARPAAGLARRRAVEDHVLHRLAAQLGGARLAEHPAHGVDDVGLAAPVRAHHADQLTWNLEVRGIDERFEASEFDRAQTHGGIGGKESETVRNLRCAPRFGRKARARAARPRFEKRGRAVKQSAPRMGPIIPSRARRPAARAVRLRPGGRDARGSTAGSRRRCTGRPPIRARSALRWQKATR
ncbi:hypothetical protein DO72_5716 [Burkholderia pseudomallei]|nr:hypothetical protein DO72_5716 [Burkholderia pseudomallei]